MMQAKAIPIRDAEYTKTIYLMVSLSIYLFSLMTIKALPVSKD